MQQEDHKQNKEFRVNILQYINMRNILHSKSCWYKWLTIRSREAHWVLPHVTNNFKLDQRAEYLVNESMENQKKIQLNVFPNPSERLSIEVVREVTKILMNLMKLKIKNHSLSQKHQTSKITSLPGKSICRKYTFSRVIILKIARPHTNQTGNTETPIGQ